MVIRVEIPGIGGAFLILSNFKELSFCGPCVPYFINKYQDLQIFVQPSKNKHLYFYFKEYLSKSLLFITKLYDSFMQRLYKKLKLNFEKKTFLLV